MTAREPTATIALHPADAADRRLRAGDPVIVANETGRLNLRVVLSDAIPRGVALAHKGKWPKQQQDGANVNVLNPGQRTDIGDSTAVHGIEVTVVPA